MKSRLAALLCLMLGGVCLPLSAQALEIVIQSEFHYNGIKAADVTDRLSVSEDGSRYTIRSEAKAVGLAKIFYGDISRVSEGIVTDDNTLQMTLYRQERQKRRQQASYTPASNELQLQKNDETKTESVEAPFFDYLTSVYQPYFSEAVNALKIGVTNGWRYKVYQFERGESETLDTALGTLDAIALTRHSERGPRIVWLSAMHGYLPVRSLIDDKGHKFETFVQSIDINH